MKKRNLIEISNALQSISHYRGVKFAYVVAKNINKLKPELQALFDAIKPDKEIEEFEQKRVELAKKYSKKDKEENPIVENNTYILDNPKEFEKEFEKLKKDNKDVVKKKEQQFAEYEKLLDEETDFKFYKIKVEDLPQDITTAELNKIFELIEENV